MKRSTSFVVTALAVVSVMSLTTLAAAQISVERHAAFASAPKVATSVRGVYTFMAPPKGFNPLTATNRELWQYGLPDPPDKSVDATGYAAWARAMQALRIHVSDFRATKITHGPMKPAGAVREAISNGAQQTTSSNWSGVAGTNKNKVWKDTTSYDAVYSIWNVPTALAPFGAPKEDGPNWVVANWNGVDGFSDGDVVQGGTDSIYNWTTGASYVGWVEWYPSYSELVADCSTNTPCPVYAGDDFYTTTFASPGKEEQEVFIEDMTTGWSGTADLAWASGPGVVGSSAEWITERPCCVDVGGESYLYPLANYIYDFFVDSYALDGNNTVFFPGATTAATYNITMLADDNITDISSQNGGATGIQGRYSIWFYDENCANTGGCAY